MNTTDTVREKQLNVRLSEEEVERLDLLASHYGLNGPAVIRMLIKRDADRVRAEAPPGGDKKPKTKR